MSSLVIVAIPAEDDYVWNISSEKKPHTTLLFLGDAATNPNVFKIQQFLEHAVNILEMGPFWLSVDERGTLGADDADVLFFRQDWGLKRLSQFRGQLLKNNVIRKAWEEADQFADYPEEWIPHLTLGYPGKPAKPDNRDYPGIRSVEFDKIGLWFGDFEGPEYKLQYNWDLEEVAMSAEKGKEFIAHYGVKGMKWGVRKSRGPKEAQARSVVRTSLQKTKVRTSGGQNHPATQDAIDAALAKQKLKRSGHAALSNQELQDLANRMDLEKRVTQLVKGDVTAPGKAFVKKELGDLAKQEVRRAAGDAARAGAKEFVKRAAAAKR
jgi:2'-5' RNA ligase